MKIMSINIRYINRFDEYSWSDRKNILFDIIDDYSPDIIGFQEVMEESLKDILTNLIDYDYYGVYRSLDDSREMNPIFYKKSKYALIDSNTLWLSQYPCIRYSKSWGSSLPRILSYAILESEDENLIVMNTHFDYLSEEARIKSSKIMLNTINKLKSQYNYPVIITGDFNTTPNDGYIDILLNSEDLDNSFNNFDDKDNSLTIHNFTGDIEGEPIDYIFVDNDLEITDSKIIRKSENNIYPSDHYQVYVEVK